MTKSELIDAVNATAAEHDIDLTKKATGELIDIIFAQVSDAINDEDRFSYPKFGTFTVKYRKEREGRNPRTKEPITIPASYSVNFKPSPTLKDLVNERLEDE